MKLGLIREERNPPDTRVALSPDQCRDLVKNMQDLEIIVQAYPQRCYSDTEYREAGVQLSNDMSGCHTLLGIKEVPINSLLADKSYLIFSHTIKKQPHNRHMLRSMLDKSITLIDYECMVGSNGLRLLGFGRFAGIVGAHNGLLSWGRRKSAFELTPAHRCGDLQELKKQFEPIRIPPIKIIICGSGRVAAGAVELLDAAGIRSVSSPDFLNSSFEEAVYCRLELEEYYRHKDGKPFVEQHFFEHPGDYVSTFKPFTKVADLMINAIYWDPQAPVFFAREEMRQKDFRIQVIADIACDMEGSIPATLRASTISEPVYGYDPQTEREGLPYQAGLIDIMAVDNLPNELPCDASADFGQALMERVIPELLNPDSEMIEKATITKDGRLTPNFTYLQDYVDGV